MQKKTLLLQSVHKLKRIWILCLISLCIVPLNAQNFYKIEMLFLKILEKEDCYGYQLTQSIQDITNGQIKIAEGTMYPILYKLQDKGYISDRQVKVGKRQTRVYYHLEPAGKEYLSQLTHDYYQMIDAIQAVLGPRK